MSTHRTSNKAILSNLIITDGTYQARLIIRNGELVFQYAITSLAWNGIENTDWAETGFAQALT